MMNIALKQPPSAARDPGLEALRPTWYEIDLDAIAENFRSLRAAGPLDCAMYLCMKPERFRLPARSRWRGGSRVTAPRV